MIMEEILIATLKDVAQQANVSKMTVSRVINQPELVTKELKELVYKAMKELNYRPNTAAKALARNRTMVVKVLILEEMDITEPYYMNLLNGIAQELDQYQYALQLMTENSVDLGNSDGYIITGMRKSDYEWIEQLDKPVILFGENRRGIPYVDSDNKAASSNATQYAINCGYEQVIFVGIDVEESFERSREKGYAEVMAAYPEKTSAIHRLSNSSSTAEKLVTDELTLQKNTCFVCASDRLAIGIERGLQVLNHNIPEEYGIIGFDGVFLDQIASPKLTTMKQDIVGMGRACVTQLMCLVDGKPLKRKELLFETELIVRGTTKEIKS